MKLPLTVILLGSAMAASAQTPMAATPPAVHGRAIADVGASLMQVSDDEDDEDGGWLSFGGDDSDEDDCDEEEEEDCPTTGRVNAAPAGTVAPPANGLFGDGKAPTASTN